ncbi:MAG: hypothetical protein AAF492_14550, partial [Verrucomicrobiota bacterium]
DWSRSPLQDERLGESADRPTASFIIPDVIINTNANTNVLVEIESENIPTGTVVQLSLHSETAADIVTNSTPLVAAGGPTNTATVNLKVPTGYSRGVLRANWTTSE